MKKRPFLAWNFIDEHPKEASGRLSPVTNDSKDSSNGFLFVSINPSSTRRAGERSRTAIRAQVMRSIHRHSKSTPSTTDVKLKSAYNDSLISRSSVYPRSTIPVGALSPKRVKSGHSKFRNFLSHPGEFQDSTLGSQHPLQWIMLDLSAENVDTRSTLYKKYNTTPSIVAESPSTLLGAGTLDPFNTYPGVGNSLFVAEMLDNLIKCVFPILVPPRPHNNINPLTAILIPYAMKTPLLFHALIANTSLHMDVLQGKEHLLNYDKLYHRGEALRILAADLRNPEGQTSDDHLMVVAGLAVHDSADIPEDNTNVFDPPLAEVGWLNVISLMNWSSVHLQMMYRIVEDRGGLDTINMVGLSDVISLLNVIDATRRLDRPRLPFLRLDQMEQAQVFEQRIRKISPDLIHLGLGFEELFSCLLDDALKDIIRKMIEFTITLGNYKRGELGDLDLPIFIYHRNKIQHKLLMLPVAANRTEEFDIAGDIFEVYRLSLLIYSTGIIFPIPTSVGTHRLLARALRKTLSGYVLLRFMYEQPDITLWILILGGMAAYGAAERAWYINILAHIAFTRGIKTLEEIREKLKRYLWLGVACDGGLKQLWEEVEAYCLDSFHIVDY